MFGSSTELNLSPFLDPGVDLNRRVRVTQSLDPTLNMRRPTAAADALNLTAQAERRVWEGRSIEVLEADDPRLVGVPAAPADSVYISDPQGLVGTPWEGRSRTGLRLIARDQLINPPSQRTDYVQPNNGPSAPIGPNLDRFFNPDRYYGRPDPEATLQPSLSTGTSSRDVREGVPLQVNDYVTLADGQRYTLQQLGIDPSVSEAPNPDSRSELQYFGFSPQQDIVGVADFDLDNKRDFLVRNRQTGEMTLWYMDGSNKIGEAPILAPAVTGYQVAGVGDLTGDGRPDIVWRQEGVSAPQTVVWSMINNTVAGSAAIPYFNATGNSWQIDAVADFNNDGLADLFWRNYTTGQNVIWSLGGLTPTAGGVVPVNPVQINVQGGATVGTDWEMVGSGDIDLNGSKDLFWRHKVTGQNSYWTMSTNYQTVLTNPALAQVGDLSYRVTTVGDINADGRADLVWSISNAQIGYLGWLINPSSNGYVSSTPKLPANTTSTVDFF